MNYKGAGLDRDECERVEVERRFSLAKRKCGMGLVTAKLRETAAHVITMSVLVLNLRKIQRALLRMLAYLLEILAQNKNWALVQWTLSKISIQQRTNSSNKKRTSAGTGSPKYFLYTSLLHQLLFLV